MRRGFKGTELPMNGSASLSTTMGYCVFNLDKESADSRVRPVHLFIVDLFIVVLGIEAANCDYLSTLLWLPAEVLALLIADNGLSSFVKIIRTHVSN